MSPRDHTAGATRMTPLTRRVTSCLGLLCLVLAACSGGTSPLAPSSVAALGAGQGGIATPAASTRDRRMITVPPNSICPIGYYADGTWVGNNGVVLGIDCAPNGDPSNCNSNCIGSSGIQWGVNGLCNPITQQGAYCPPSPKPSPTATPQSASARILTAALKYVGFITRNIPNTGHGAVACAYMVNRILSDAISRTYGDGYSVASLVQALDADTADVTKLGTDASLAKKGDIVVMDGTDYANALNQAVPDAQGHIGICMTDGCTEILSNSTGQRKFMNNFHDSNMGLPASEPATFYHINQ